MTPSAPVRAIITMLLLSGFIYEVRSGKVLTNFGIKTRERNPEQYSFWIDVHAVFLILLIGFWIIYRS